MLLMRIPKLHDPEGIHQGLILLWGKLGTQSGHVGILNTSMGVWGYAPLPLPSPPPPNKIITTLCVCSPSISITRLLRSASVWGEFPLDDPVGRLP